MRCLAEDLNPEVEPEALRVALRTAKSEMADDGTFLFPCSLFEVEHLVIDKANLIATDESAEHEPIRAITDRVVTKVKTSDRRGAIWQDVNGRWWLLAAGRRKDDGPGDFYRELERFSGTSSAALGPTEQDQRYLKLEVAYEAECEREKVAHRQVLNAVFRASRALGTAVSTEVFGASMSLRIDADEKELAVVEAGWDFVRYDEADRFPLDVLAMIPGLGNIDLWGYLPPRVGSGQHRPWYAYVSQNWVDQLAESVEIGELIGDLDAWSPPNPSTDGSENFSHRAASEIVTLAYVEGIEIVGLCGAKVVPHRDFEQYAECPTCRESLELLRTYAAHPGQ